MKRWVYILVAVLVAVGVVVGLVVWETTNDMGNETRPSPLQQEYERFVAEHERLTKEGDRLEKEVNEVADYGYSVSDVLRETADTADRISSLLQNPKIDDANWLSEMRDASNALIYQYGDIMNIPPPERCNKSYGLFLKGYECVNELAVMNMRAIKNQDVELLEQCIAKLSEADGYLAEGTDAFDVELTLVNREVDKWMQDWEKYLEDLEKYEEELERTRSFP